MLSYFKNRKLYKEFMKKVASREIGVVQLRELLPTFPNSVLHRIGKDVVYSKYDGYNYNRINQSMCYFDNLDRSGKEFYIEQRFYDLLCSLN